jgi:hypothetical protein
MSTDRLVEFLRDPPDAEEWVYDGYRHGGHELCWSGAGLEVRFHVHFTGRSYEGNPDWRFGGAWMRGAHSEELNVCEARELYGPMLPVVQQHWIAMLDAERDIQAGRPGDTPHGPVRPVFSRPGGATRSPGSGP